ncbi:hypothetical protein [Brevundimonas sp. AAP58]|uniref:hypothetical protein n=1 Tax=Brevundimonas sp. AAP58 TaxID=1523422 RepID=UPI000AF65C9E|nr:hypothetical protein [Brevundimonas sp. AAP58]
MSALFRRRRALDPDDRLLEPEVWEQPRRLTRREGLNHIGADWRSTRSDFHAETNDD